MPEKPRVCIDRVLPADMNRWMPTQEHRGATRAVIVFRKLWMNGQHAARALPRRHGGAARQGQGTGAVVDAAREPQFDFNNAPRRRDPRHLRRSDGAWSYVGTDDRGIPLDQPTMNLGFMDGGTAGHEFGHAIGLAHEHQNPRRRHRVERGTGDPGPVRPAQQLDRGHDPPQRAATSTPSTRSSGTAFDPDSIMLYFFPASWTKTASAPRRTTCCRPSTRPSSPSAQAYPKTRRRWSTRTDQGRRHHAAPSASIGKAGEEDLFRFTVTPAARHHRHPRADRRRDEAFGPNSPTALIAEDDDSGVDTNALIRGDLIPGLYYVQVRHYNKASGTGEYRVRVRTT